MKGKTTLSPAEYRQKQGSDPGHMLLIIYLAAVVFFLLLGSFSQASGEEFDSERQLIGLEEVSSGQLLIAAEETGKYIPAPILDQKVDIAVSGMVVNTRLKQRFSNTGEEWIEAVYVFPLPDESAVQSLRMIVGERVIEGKIKEKNEARAIYEQAKSEGKKTSLLAQKRPNIFTMAVANIPPRSVVEVEIEYLDSVRLDNKVFSLRFPMVVGPRYIPGSPLPVNEQHLAFDEGGWAVGTDQVKDAAQITPPVTEPGEGPLNPVELTLTLAPGFPAQKINSLYHGIQVSEAVEGIYHISFDGKVFADRDFVLEYQTANQKEVTAALFNESSQEAHFTYLMITPPLVAQENKVPREVVFVLDISGSMAGSSIRQAKEALVKAVSRLRDSDRFNVIVFNNSARMLFAQAISADAENKEKASQKIAALEANGGTEIASALRLALDGRTDHQRIRQVVFLTDGAVGNELALFSHIAEQRGDTRLYTVGIGSAPNSYFMTRAAAMGRGSYCFIGKVEEVEDKMTALLAKLENPVVTGLKLETSGGEEIEMYPELLPDLYRGEPVVALLKSEQPLSVLRLSGSNLGQPWTVTIEGSTAKSRPGIGALWARKKIRSLMESIHLGANEDEVRRKVVETALKHHLVSRYTSLVAVEERVSRPEMDALHNKQLKTNLPQGWQHGKVFGTAARTGTPSTLLLVTGWILLGIGMLLSVRRRRIK